MPGQDMYFLIHIFCDRSDSYSKPFKVFVDGTFLLTEEYVIEKATKDKVLTAEELNIVDLVEIIDEKTYKECGGK